MKGCVDCSVYTPVGSLGVLQGVQEWVGEGFKVGQDKALKRLHEHRGQCNRPVVIKGFFFGTGVMVEALKQAGQVACLLGGVEEQNRESLWWVMESRGPC